MEVVLVKKLSYFCYYLEFVCDFFRFLPPVCQISTFSVTRVSRSKRPTAASDYSFKFIENQTSRTGENFDQQVDSFSCCYRSFGFQAFLAFLTDKIHTKIAYTIQVRKQGKCFDVHFKECICLFFKSCVLKKRAMKKLILHRKSSLKGVAQIFWHIYDCISNVLFAEEWMLTRPPSGQKLAWLFMTHKFQ